MIKMQVIGRLGKDATKNTVGGKNVINFSVAHSEKVRDAQGNSTDKTVWVECSYWTERLGIFDYLKKGQQVFVEGNGDIRTYTNNDGAFGASLRLNIRDVQLLGSANNNGGNSGSDMNNVTNQGSTGNIGAPAAPVAKTATNLPTGFDDNDDLPF
jgi:single-strand DNA-binding protein